MTKTKRRARRFRYTIRNPRGSRKKDARTEAEVFEEGVKLNPRLTGARTDAVDAVGYYTARIVELLEEAKAGQGTLREEAVYDALGLREPPRSGCVRSVLGNVIDRECTWCDVALTQLEEGGEIIRSCKGGHTLVRLATAADKEKEQLEKEREKKREAELKRVRAALGPNAAYPKDGEDGEGGRWYIRRPPMKGPRVTYSGPAYRRLVKLLEREGLISKE